MHPAIHKHFVALVVILGCGTGLIARAQCEPCDRRSNADLLPPMVGQATNFALRRAGAEVDARWKIPVSIDGFYRLTGAQLLAAGMPADQLIGSRIRLFNRTQEVAITVSTTNLFTASDTIHFYGIQHDGAYNRTNAYWLGLGGVGRRMTNVSGLVMGSELLVSSVCYRALYNPKLLHRPYHQPLDDSIDHWFAALVTHSGATSFQLNTSNRVHGQNVRISLEMYGLTQLDTANPDHGTRVTINGSTIATATYDDTVYLFTNYTVNSSVLNSGMSTVAVQQILQPGVSQDSAYLISLGVDYLATNTMRKPAHEFCGRAGTNLYRVLNVNTNGGIRVLDISNPHHPVAILNPVVTNNTTIEFRYVSSGVPRLAVIQSNGVISAAAPEFVAFRNLADQARSADYLLITPYEFRQQAYRLARQRYTNGLRVVVAPLPDIYNEFGYGVVDTTSIKQFIGYAYHHWTPPRPRFALLLGEGTYDPMGRVAPIPIVSLPTPFGPTPQVVAAVDTWYGLVDGTTNVFDNDALPDVMVGRISISALGPLSNAVNKIIAFDGAPIVSNALLVADKFDGTNNFEASSQTYIENIIMPNGYAVTRSYNSLAGTFNNTFIKNSINSGRRLVTYVGHGALDRWSSPVAVWTTNDVVTLNNTVYPVVTIFSCQNGSFVDWETNCLSEIFVEAPRAASSVFSPTALSVQLFADYMAAGFMTSLAIQQRRYLGDVAFQAYLNLWSFNPNVSELRTYQIIGDPGLIVNRPGTLP